MAELDADSDMDAQDVAEVFDEDATDGDNNLSDALDLRPDVYDVTSALGDEDLDGVDDALDADEESDEVLDGLDDEGRSADTADEDGDDLVDHVDLQPEPLDDDNVQLATTDVDFEDEDDTDGVSRRSASEPEEISMSETAVDELGGASARVSDLEADNLSDADLKELGYE
jgi:hypothetical protein